MKNNSRNFYAKFKIRLTGYYGRELFIRHKTGDVAESAKENSRILAEFYDPLNCEPPED